MVLECLQVVPALVLPSKEFQLEKGFWLALTGGVSKNSVTGTVLRQGAR